MYASFCKLPYIYIFFFCYKTEWDDDNAFLRPPLVVGLLEKYMMYS